MEQTGVGPDGITMVNHDDDNTSNDGSQRHLGQKKRSNSVDTLASVEDPNTIDHRKSKRRLNEHVFSDGRTGPHGAIVDDKHGQTDGKGSNRRAGGSDPQRLESADTNTNMIYVMSDDKNVGINGGPGRHMGTNWTGTNGDLFDDEFSDSEIGKDGDRDSGMDDDDEDVDVALSEEQQQMVVKMLFDEDMNLRPQFYRNDDGQIVVRLRLYRSIKNEST